jgi:hypothetical protein
MVATISAIFGHVIMSGLHIPGAEIKCGGLERSQAKRLLRLQLTAANDWVQAIFGIVQSCSYFIVCLFSYVPEG